MVACTLYSGVLYAGVWRAIVCLLTAQGESETDRAKCRLFEILLYVLCDNLIAANKFIINSENTWALHMATYFSAQYLLTESSLVILSREEKIATNGMSEVGRSFSADLTSFIRAWVNVNQKDATDNGQNSTDHIHTD